eukprot:5456248-Prymnesium_polylepis.1
MRLVTQEGRALATVHILGARLIGSIWLDWLDDLMASGPHPWCTPHDAHAPPTPLAPTRARRNLHADSAWADPARADLNTVMHRPTLACADPCLRRHARDRAMCTPPRVPNRAPPCAVHPRPAIPRPACVRAPCASGAASTSWIASMAARIAVKYQQRKAQASAATRGTLPKRALRAPRHGKRCPHARCELTQAAASDSNSLHVL